MKNRNPLNEKNLYRMVNVFLLSCICVLSIGKQFGIQTGGMWHAGLSLLGVMVIFGIDFLLKKGRVLSLLGITGFFIILGTMVGVSRIYQFFFSYINWLGNKAGWKQEWVIGYETVQVLAIVAICFFVEFMQGKDIRIKGAIGGVLFGFLLHDMFTEQNMSGIAVVFILGYLIFVLIEWTQNNWSKVKKSSIHGYMLWMFPFVAVFFVLMTQIPVSQEPYDWQFFKDAYKKINETIYQFTGNLFDGGEEFDLRLSGFSQKGNLGGGFFDNEKKIMTIEGDKRLKTNVYLTGKVFADFDGSSWHPTENESDMDHYMDTVEILYAVERYNKENQYDYLQYTDLEICYRYQKTDSLFVPIKTRSVKKQGKNVDFTLEDGTLHFDKKPKYGTKFHVEYYQLNTNEEIFYDFLESKNMQDEELLESILANMKDNTSMEITKENLDTYRQSCYDNYLDEIELSKEVEDYLSKITENAETDVEKLKAIEEELSSFTYSQNPGEMPDMVDDGSGFLDYFLLDSKQGYCTYFATAFVLLARAEGIPARYVQGYCVPISSDESMTVTSAMAHAWPEVYLDGIGWVPFEPTPGYKKMRYSSWTTKKQNESKASYGEEYYRYDTIVEAAAEDTREEENPEDAFLDKEVNQLPELIAKVIFSTVLIVIILFFTQRIFNRYRYKKMNDAQKYAIEIGRIFKILNKLGLKRKDEETLTEFKKRIEEVLRVKKKFFFISDYENVLYGVQTADKKMLELVTGEIEQIMQIIKKRKKITYYYCRIIM